jgi:hypothetical protein
LLFKCFCHSIDTNSGQSCSEGEIILASLYQTTNSHISLGDDSNYPIKICCSAGETFIEPPYLNLSSITDLNWTDFSTGLEVSSVLNKTVVNISVFGTLFAGQKFDYKVYHKESLIGLDILAADKIVSSGTHVITSEEASSGVSYISWLALWNDSDSGDSEYYFEILNDLDTKTSSSLSVSKDNNPDFFFTKTKITSPSEGNVYLTNEAIPLSWAITEQHFSIQTIEFITEDGIINDDGNGVILTGSQDYLLNLPLNVSFSTSGQKEITLITTDELGYIYESKVSILILSEGINLFAGITSPEHSSVYFGNEVQFSGLSSYIINATTVGSEISISCVLGNCPNSLLEKMQFN